MEFESAGSGEPGRDGGERRGLPRRFLRWALGPDPAPEFVRSRRFFLAGLGAVYGVAFASLWIQVQGLFGARGIRPASRFLARAREALGERAWLDVPSVLWWRADDAALTTLCLAGVALAFLPILGLAPRIALALLWLGYLSLVSIGSPFLDFQWDALLLETGLLAILFAPGGLLPHRGVERPPSRVALFLLRWLLFRLIVLSGLVKLAAGDETWRDLSALSFHYWTQPLPHRAAWFVDKLPDGVHRACVVATLALEVVLPFAVFGPRRLRLAAVAGVALLMTTVTLTGNYGFFTLLTLVLCLPLVDDGILGRSAESARTEPAKRNALGTVRRALVLGFAALALALTTGAGLRRLGWIDRLPAPIDRIERRTRPLRSFNAYGLFATMTTERPEIVVEGSRDGTVWRAYEFRWKPGDTDRAPGWAGPHMPRLDWQMWFAALSSWRSQTWYLDFVRRLLEGSPEVAALLSHDPFGGEPPRFVRSTLWSYEFTDRAQRGRTGAWWSRERVAPYAPTLTLVDGELRAAR